MKTQSPRLADANKFEIAKRGLSQNSSHKPRIMLPYKNLYIYEKFQRPSFSLRKAAVLKEI